MQKRITLFIFLSTCLISFFSCSQSDDIAPQVQIPINITVLGADLNSILQANIDEGTNVTTYNLTDNLGVNPNSILMDLHNYENTFGLYFPPPFVGEYTVWEKNMNTNEGIVYNDFCIESTIETAYFPQVSDDYITVFTAELVSTGNRILNLRIYNKALGFCTKTSIGVSDQFQQLSRLIAGNSILTYHFNDQGQTVITKISLETSAVEGQLTFDAEGAVTVRGDKIFFYPSTGDRTQVSYDFATLQMIESSNISVRPFLGTGLFKTETQGNSILIDGNYIQPFEFPTFPALFDQETGNISQLADLAIINIGLIANLDSELAIDVAEEYTVDLNNNILVGSFVLFNTNVTVVEYGVYYASFSGEILGTVPIDFPASKIIIR
jgi:hypothetical protein